MSLERSLATLMFTDIVGSTERAAELGDLAWRALLGKHYEVVRRELRRHGGREIATAGDGFLATFDEPAAAILCACAARDAVAKLGLEIRSGVHMGAVEWEEHNVGGIAVHIGARVAAHAAPGEVLVSSTVRDLEAGSGFIFEDRGVHTLKGVPGEWRLFAVASCPSVPTGARRRVRRARMAQGRGVLAGAAAFLLLFLAAGLYVGVFSREGKHDDERLEPAPPSTIAEARPAAATPAPDTTLPEGGKSDARSPEDEGASSSYESARRSAGESRREALEAGAVLLSQDLFQQAEGLHTAALRAAREGSYVDAERKMREAEESYDRAASAAGWRAKIDSARRAVSVVRGRADRRAGAYRTGESWERRGAEAEKAERYAEAVDYLGNAADAYRKAGPAVQVTRPPLPPPGQRRRPAAPAEEEPAPRPLAPTAPPPAEQPPSAVEDRKPPEAKAEGTPATPPEDAVDREAVERTLGELKRAIEGEDMEALRRTWVSLTPSDARNFTRWFSLMRSIEVRHDVRSMRATGDRIVVELQTTYEFFNKSTDQEERQVVSQVLELEERAGRWVVAASPR